VPVGLPRRGFTLIELLVALAILGILTVLAMPRYIEWIADAHIRNGAESVVAGLREAMNVAIRENTRVEFTIVPTTKTGGWTVQYPGGATITKGAFAEGADRAAFAVLPAGNTTVTFTGIGVIPPLNLDGTAPFENVDVTNPVGTMTLRVLVPVNTATGRRSGIKVCDTRWPVDDPKGCPAPTP
jgi:prepilin-type N-terminal cleavage/methylation domain-containing protein